MTHRHASFSSTFLLLLCFRYADRSASIRQSQSQRSLDWRSRAVWSSVGTAYLICFNSTHVRRDGSFRIRLDYNLIPASHLTHLHERWCALLFSRCSGEAGHSSPCCAATVAIFLRHSAFSAFSRHFFLHLPFLGLYSLRQS